MGGHCCTCPGAGTGSERHEHSSVRVAFSSHSAVSAVRAVYISEHRAPGETEEQMARPIPAARLREPHFPDVAAVDVFDHTCAANDEASVDPDAVAIETNVILDILCPLVQQEIRTGRSDPAKYPHG